MNRIDRISSILIQLQSRKVIRAQDIADRFQISLRTVYRDINTLVLAGIPIIGEAGVGYSLADGFRLPPIMFTTDEAAAFLTAEKLVEKLTDKITNNNYQTALYKIKATLKSIDKEYLCDIEENIAVLENKYLPKHHEDDQHLQEILKNVRNKTVIDISYFANHDQAESNRSVEPVGIFFAGSHWHLIAFCQLRNDYRNFRIDRIKQLKSTTRPYLKKHPSLQTYLKAITNDDKEVHHVVLRLNKSQMKCLGEQKYYMGYVSEKIIKDEIEVTFLTSSLEGFARWYMMMGDKSTIILPKSLKDMVHSITTNLLKNIS
jgi:predicted DNA-binding transcriptional regulator YafY